MNHLFGLLPPRSVKLIVAKHLENSLVHHFLLLVINKRAERRLAVDRGLRFVDEALLRLRMLVYVDTAVELLGLLQALGSH